MSDEKEVKPAKTVSVSHMKNMTDFQRHNFSQQRMSLENKLKLRSLYKGIKTGQA